MKKGFLKSKIFLLLGILLIPSIIFSFIFTTKINASNLISLDQNSTVDKTYFAAGEVLDIKGTINGDAFLAGSSVSFSGVINGNLYVAGNNVNLKGIVNGMVFAAGNIVEISSTGINSIYLAGNLVSSSSDVSKNAYITGNSVGLKGVIGQDLFLSGNTINLYSNISRDLSLSSVFTNFNSQVGRNASIISESVYFSQDSKILGDLSKSDSMQTSSDLSSIVNGKISIVVSSEYDEKNVFLENFKSKVFGKLTVGLFSIIIIGIFLIKNFEKQIIKINKDIEKNYKNNFLKGFLFIILVPLISIGFLITLIGFKLAMIIFSVYFLFMTLVSVIASIFLGEFLMSKVMKHKTHGLYLSLVSGSLLLILLTIIPFIGWAFALFITSITAGSLYNFFGDIKKNLVKKA